MKVNCISEETMKKTTNPSFCADQMKVLSDVTRLWVLEELLAGSKNVKELIAALKIEQSLLSHHLQVLRQSGLVRATRDGKAVRYEIAPEAKGEAGGNAINLGCCRISFDGLPKRT
jgi:ArsR family transcriptional regulator